MFDNKELEKVKEYLEKTPGRVYLGCDSIKFKKHNQWYARYTTVLVVHIENSKGGKIFGHTELERDFDQKRDKPRMRLMNEVYKVTQLYDALEDLLIDRDVEIHLDINPDERHASNTVIREAVGYVMGMTGIKAKVKPEAFAASYAADAGVRKAWFTN